MFLAQAWHLVLTYLEDITLRASLSFVNCVLCKQATVADDSDDPHSRRACLRMDSALQTVVPTKWLWREGIAPKSLSPKAFRGGKGLLPSSLRAE